MKLGKILFSPFLRYGLPPDVRPTHIIVGGGSAGCVIANRLSEDAENRVLLLEAGPRDHWWNWKIHMPSALMYNLCNDFYNWYYHTQPEKYMNERVMYWPRGRVLGGSSTLNAMCYVRGHPLDYDRWANKENCPGWSYADCLPYFKKAETFHTGPNEYRGADGPLHVQRYTSINPLYQAFIEAGEQAGYGRTEDMNGYRQEGFAPMDCTIKSGIRWSASRAYIWPILGKRKNLFLETGRYVERVVFGARNEATGVIIKDRNMNTKKIYAEKEVILCGGAINTPHILHLSGIGHGDLMRTLEIDLVHHLPGVGKNLQDHLELYIQYECSQPLTLYNKVSWRNPINKATIGLEWLAMQTGLGASAHLEAGAFVRSRENVEHPDIQFHFLPSIVLDHGRKTINRHAFQAHVGTMRPTSRGGVVTVNKNLFDLNKQLIHPQIYVNYLATEQDRADMRECVHAARRVFSQKAFDGFRGLEISPGPRAVSDQQIDAFIRANADSAYHPCGTCKMGSENDETAVVDARTLKVLGVENLRVVDASLMPSVVSGNLNAPVIMMAEKAADIIRGREPLPKADVPVWTPSGQKSSLNLSSK